MENYLIDTSKTISLLKIDYSKQASAQFSIVIPVYQRANALEGLLESIRLQDIPSNNFEIVIVDNTEDQQKQKKIESSINKYQNLPIRYFCNKINIGMASNWNRCFELARTSWVFMVHADDLLCYGTIEFILYTIKYYGSLYDCMFFGRKEIMYSTKNIDLILNENIFRRFLRLAPYKKIDFLYGSVPCAPTGMLLKRDVFINLGGYNNILSGYPLDLDFLFRMLKYNYSIVKISKICVLKREGENDTLTSNEHYRTSWINGVGNLLKENIKINSRLKQYLFKMIMNDLCRWGHISPTLLDNSLNVRENKKYEEYIWKFIRKIHILLRYL